MRKTGKYAKLKKLLIHNQFVFYKLEKIKKILVIQDVLAILKIEKVKIYNSPNVVKKTYIWQHIINYNIFLNKSSISITLSIIEFEYVLCFMPDAVISIRKLFLFNL